MHKAIIGRISTPTGLPVSRSMLKRGLLASRQLHTTTVASYPNHTPDTYAKEVDTTPVGDKTVNRLDPDTDSVQRPYEPPSGPWSRAGVKSDEYVHVETGEAGKQPDTPSNGSNGRYGAQKDWAEAKGFETSKPDEGPNGKSSPGRR